MPVLKNVRVGAVMVLLLTSFSVAENDPPARAARLDYVSGQVSIQPSGVDDWVAASINRPMTSSDKIWTDRESRAEVQLGGAALRMNEQTSVTLANVLDNNVQVQLDQGTMNVNVVELFPGEVYEIDTPNVAFIIRKAGDYRFDVDNSGDTTTITVFRGKGEATGNSRSITIDKDERYTFTGDRSLQFTANHNPGRDGFDDWCLSRAQMEENSVSARYVSRYAVGYSDLDRYGSWDTVAAYGPIWYPSTIAVGWAPYRYGHWVWISPWGWTWVDDAPWGFAPFHYGRWVYYGSRWGWCPGPRHYRPYYSPALVAWVGGSHWGVGLSFGVGGGVGWFPLGWDEPYIPYYRHSRHYFERVNVTNIHVKNVTVINNYYNTRNIERIHHKYREHPYAVTAVSNDVFRGSRPTRDNVVLVNKRDLKNLHVERDVMVRPTTNSVLGVNAGHERAVPPQAAMKRWNDRGPDRTRVANTPERPDERPRGIPGSAPATPVAHNAGTPQSRDAAFERPGRNFPHPPERGNTINSAELNRNGEAGRSRELPNSLRSSPDSMSPRVPRPAQPVATDQRGGPDRSIHGTDQAELERPHYRQPVTPTTNNETRVVPRPSPGREVRQEQRGELESQRAQKMERLNPDRSSRGEHIGTDVRPATQGPDRRPATPTQQERVAPQIRQERPQPRTETPVSRAPEVRTERPAPQVERSTPEPRVERSAPQRETPRSAPQSRPEKIEKLSQHDGGRASLRQPPYGGYAGRGYGSSFAQRSHSPARSNAARTYSTPNYRSSNVGSSYTPQRSFSAYTSQRTATSYASGSNSYQSRNSGSSYRASPSSSGGGSHSRWSR